MKAGKTGSVTMMRAKLLEAVASDVTEKPGERRRSSRRQRCWSRASSLGSNCCEESLPYDSFIDDKSSEERRQGWLRGDRGMSLLQAARDVVTQAA